MVNLDNNHPVQVGWNLKRKVHQCRYCKRVIPPTLDFCCENCLFLFKKSHRPTARKVVKK